MFTLIKTLEALNGELFVTSAGQRKQLARFTGEVKINEETMLIPVLGRTEKGVKKIYASFIVCGDLGYSRPLTDDSIHSGKIFDITADVNGERLLFAGLRFEDSDPIENTLTFEITDLELIKKLLGV